MTFVGVDRGQAITQNKCLLAKINFVNINSVWDRKQLLIVSYSIQVDQNAVMSSLLIIFFLFSVVVKFMLFFISFSLLITSFTCAETLKSNMIYIQSARCQYNLHLYYVIISIPLFMFLPEMLYFSSLKIFETRTFHKLTGFSPAWYLLICQEIISTSIQPSLFLTLHVNILYCKIKKRLAVHRQELIHLFLDSILKQHS